MDQLQWWLEEESAEWVVEEERHLRADYIWQISREARLGDEGRVWQQWKAVTGVWKAAAAKAAAVNTAGSTGPAVEAAEATATATNEMEAAATIQAGDKTAEDEDWLEVLAAVAMAEATADSKAVAGYVRKDNPLSQPMGAKAATREGSAVADKATGVVETAAEVAASTTGESAANTTKVAARATMEAVVWDIVEAAARACAARRPEIEVEEQPGQKSEGVQHMATDAIVEAVDEQGKGANGGEIQAQSKVFDPGKFQYSTL